MTRRRWILCGLFGLLALCSPMRVAAVGPCPAARNCAEIGVQVPAAPVAPGATALVRLGLIQGANDQQAGGVDEVAALTVTLGIPGLQLADCSPAGADGLNPSFVLGPGAAGHYRAVVQNLTCAQRTSCLCPPTGTSRDAYVNLLLVGTSNGGGVQPLPSGVLLDITLRVPSDTVGPVPLHVYSALDDTTLPRPAGGAWLSIADPQAIDRTLDTASDTMNIRITDGALSIGGTTPTQTISPTASVTGTVTASVTATVTPPATATATATATVTMPPPPTATVSATATATATTTVSPVACVGDCDHSNSVSVNELIAGVSIALGSLPLSVCPAFDCAGTGHVEVRCLIAGVNAALGGCPGKGTALSR